MTMPSITDALADSIASSTFRANPTPPPDGDATKVARGFEELLLGQLLQAMRATIPEGEDSGFAQDSVVGMFDQAIAESASGQLGLDRALTRQLGGGPLPASVGREAQPGHREPTPVRWSAPELDRSAAPRRPVLRTEGQADLGVRWSKPNGHSRSLYGVVGATWSDSANDETPAGRIVELRASRHGLVTFAGPKPGEGNVVEVLHDDGETTRYPHAGRLFVRPGDRVDLGETVADAEPST